MRKINAKFDNSDRVVCVSIPGKHEFYYQPAGTRERIWLFDTKDFSGSIFDYFRDKGRNMNDRGFSLTIKELYEFKKYRDHKLATVMKRIPSQVEYVIRKRTENERSHNQPIAARLPESLCFGLDDDERAA